MNSLSKELLTYVIKTEVENKIISMNDELSTKMHLLSLEILENVRNVLSQHDKLSDFEIVEKIVCIFEKYNIDCNSCHDFG